MTNNPSKIQKTRRPSGSFAKRGLVSLLAAATTSVVALSGVQGAVATGPDTPAPVTPTTTSTAPVALEPPMTTVGPNTTSAASAWNTVRLNSIYRTGNLGASKCAEPKYPLNTAGNVKAYHLSFLYCLNNVWVGKIKATGRTFSKPTLVVHQSGVNSPCGRIPADNTYYCAASKGIYVAWPRYVSMYKNYGQWYARAYAMQIIAHEYGHHVQAMTGILQASYYRQRYVLKTTAARLEENRRMELQASCLSAAYLGADRAYFPMRGQIYNSWRWMVANMGDDAVAGGVRDHGSKKSHNFWSLSGYNGMNAGKCVTWAGSPATVA